MLKGTEMEVRNHFEEKHGMETFIIFIDSRMRIKMDQNQQPISTSIPACEKSIALP